MVQTAQATANNGGGGVDIGGILSGTGDLFGGLLGGIATLKGNAPATVINQAPAPTPVAPSGNAGNWMMYAIGVVVFIVLALFAYKILSK